MQQIPILQMVNGEPDVSASAVAYAEGVRQWGLPTVHTQLLQELRAWLETVPDWRRQPRMALERTLDVEGSILMDASVTGLAAEHIPFLYTVLGEVFDELGPEFRRALHQEAALAEKAHEDDTHAQMAEIGTEDRLDAVYEGGTESSICAPGLITVDPRPGIAGLAFCHSLLDNGSPNFSTGGRP